MGRRTNKIWILKKKMKLQKNKIIKNVNIRLKREKIKNMKKEELKQLWLLINKTNPIWNTYERVKIWRKWFN